MVRLDAFIISWTGTHDAAVAIHDAIRPTANRTTVVFSDCDDTFAFESRVAAVRRPNQLMFGDKLRACLDLFAGDVFLLAHADCTCSDWPRLCQTVVDDFTTHGCAVWSPDVTNSSPPLENAEIIRLPGTSLSLVANIDALVFALDRPAVLRLLRSDIEANVHGWWSPVPVVADALLRGKRVVMNRRVKVEHAKGRGYESSAAAALGHRFLDGLSADERAIWTTLDHWLNRNRHRPIKNALYTMIGATPIWRQASRLRRWMSASRNKVYHRSTLDFCPSPEGDGRCEDE